MHPLLKSHILFYSNGLAIELGLPNNSHMKVNKVNLIELKKFTMHPLLKAHSDGRFSYLARFTKYQQCESK